MINNRLAWFLMELPALLLVWIWYALGTAETNSPTTIFLALWTLLYGHRSLIYPLRIRTKGKKMPFSIMFSAFFFNLVNGTLIDYYIDH